MRCTLIALALLTAPQAAQAEQEVHRFSIYVSGLKAATLQTLVTRNGKAFSVSGSLSPTRFMRTLRDVGYAGQSAGTFKGTTFTPRRHSGHTGTGDRDSQVRLRFTNGIPAVDFYLPERDRRNYDIDPTRQRGTIDPLTATATLFVDQPAATLCNRTIQMFDGRRRSKITVAAQAPSESNAP